MNFLRFGSVVLVLLPSQCAPFTSRAIMLGSRAHRSIILRVLRQPGRLSAELPSRRTLAVTSSPGSNRVGNRQPYCSDVGLRVSPNEGEEAADDCGTDHHHHHSGHGTSSKTENRVTNNRSQLPPSLPNKGDLYSDEELQKILNLHQSLSNDNAFASSSTTSSTTATATPNAISSLHDLVMQAVQDADQTANGKDKDAVGADEQGAEVSSVDRYKQLCDANEHLRERVRTIRAIASDVDGTLLKSDCTLHSITRAAMLEAIAVAQSSSNDDEDGDETRINNNKTSSLQYFFPATGKTRAGVMNSVGPDVAEMLSKLPGVFVQGLYCVDGTGKVVFEQKLPFEWNDGLGDVEDLIHDQGLTVLAVDGDVLYTTDKSYNANPHHLDLVVSQWEDARPIVIPSISGYDKGFHKLLAMADTSEEIDVFRPQWEELARRFGATVTQSVPTMLELLPPNSGKAVGVRELCKALGIDVSTQLMAIGDGENDLELLQQASIGVAMGNAMDALKQDNGVDIVLTETNNEGGAGLAISLFGLGKVLE